MNLIMNIPNSLTDKNKNFFLRNMYNYVNNEENWK